MNQSNQKIFIADDDSLRLLLEFQLQEADYTVPTSENGVQAFASTIDTIPKFIRRSLTKQLSLFRQHIMPKMIFATSGIEKPNGQHRKYITIRRLQKQPCQISN